MGMVEGSGRRKWASIYGGEMGEKEASKYVVERWGRERNLVVDALWGEAELEEHPM